MQNRGRPGVQELHSFRHGRGDGPLPGHVRRRGLPQDAVEGAPGLRGAGRAGGWWVQRDSFCALIRAADAGQATREKPIRTMNSEIMIGGFAQNPINRSRFGCLGGCAHSTTQRRDGSDALKDR